MLGDDVPRPLLLSLFPPQPSRSQPWPVCNSLTDDVTDLYDYCLVHYHMYLFWCFVPVLGVRM